MAGWTRDSPALDPLTAAEALLARIACDEGEQRRIWEMERLVEALRGAAERPAAIVDKPPKVVIPSRY